MTTLCKDKNAAEKSYEDVTKQFEDKKSVHRNEMAVLTSKLNSLGFHSLQPGIHGPKLTVSGPNGPDTERFRIGPRPRKN